MNYLNLSIVIISLLFFGCSNTNPNLNNVGQDELKSLELERDLKKSDQQYKETLYVPIYSDIYVDYANQSLLLSASLSIRNTSLNDSLFISIIDYYDTNGKLVRNYIDKPIVLGPMATVNYVVEREDTAGGHGANFIVNLSSENGNIKPLVQAIMIGMSGNKGFSFLTDAYPIE